MRSLRCARLSSPGIDGTAVSAGTVACDWGGVDMPIGTCYLPSAATPEGTTFEIEIRGKRVGATVTKPPFYKDASHL